MDIVGYINSQLTSWSTAKKTDFLDKLAKAMGYSDGDSLTKKEYINSEIVKDIKEKVDGMTYCDEVKKITYEKIDFNN